MPGIVGHLQHSPAFAAALSAAAAPGKAAPGKAPPGKTPAAPVGIITSMSIPRKQGSVLVLPSMLAAVGTGGGEPCGAAG